MRTYLRRQEHRDEWIEDCGGGGNSVNLTNRTQEAM